MTNVEVEKRDSTDARYRCSIKSGCMSRRLEIGILAVVITTIFGLYSLPTIFYAFPPLKTEQIDDKSDPLNFTISCSHHRVKYEGNVCQNELQEWQGCFSDQLEDTNQSLSNNTTVDQEQLEGQAKEFLETIESFLGAECGAASRTYLCLHMFGPCDTDYNHTHHASMEECVKRQDLECLKKWVRTMEIEILSTANCEALLKIVQLSESLNCSNGQNTTTNITGMSSSSIQCSEGFYFNGSVCIPECGRWRHPNHIANPKVETGIVIFCCLIALVSGIAFILIAATLQRKMIWVFPSFYLVYVTITMIVFALVILIGTTNQTALFCSSRDLLETFANETHFCTFSGILYYYLMLQLSMWLLFHSGALFWGILFPFHYRRWKDNGRLKRVHIATIVIALLVPTITSLVNLKNGFVSFSSPTFICRGRSSSKTYATYILPFSIAWAASSSMLVVTFWTIFKQMLLKKLSAGKGVRHIIKVSKAEMKILFIMCYYIIFGVLYLVFLCLTTVTREKTRMALFDYFSCESESSNMQDCDSLNTAEVRFLDVLSIVVYFLLGMIPLVILIFGVNIKLKAIKKGMLMKYHQTSITFKSILSRQTVAVSTPSDLNESRIDQLE